MSKPKTTPLEGVKILDLTTMLSGPLATMILADQGAEVIKVESPSGDYTRSLGHRQNGISSMFINNNRNKQSIALDLKSVGGQKILTKLVEYADVIVENFRPGVATRLGLDFVELRKDNPKLICVSINGFGSDGPLSAKPTYDPIIQAMSGLATIQAGSDDERPMLVRTILADKVTALTAAQGVTAAIFARERTGTGDQIEISMLDSVLQFLWASDMNAHTFIDQPASQDAAASFIDLLYEVSDGYVTISVMTDRQWAGLCEIMGVPELVVDKRFSTAAAREKNVDERLTLTQNNVRNFKRSELLTKLEEIDVPCAPVLRRSEIWKHPHIVHTNSMLELEQATAGTVRQAAPAIRFTEHQNQEHHAAPNLGADRDQILHKLGFKSNEIIQLGETGAFGEDV